VNHVKFPNGENLRHGSMINVEKENNQREKKKRFLVIFFLGRYVYSIHCMCTKTNIKSFNYKLTLPPGLVAWWYPVPCVSMSSGFYPL